MFRYFWKDIFLEQIPCTSGTCRGLPAPMWISSSRRSQLLEIPARTMRVFPMAVRRSSGHTRPLPATRARSGEAPKSGRAGRSSSMTGVGFSRPTSRSRPCGFGSVVFGVTYIAIAAEQYRRRNVLVEAKEVGRVVSRLQGNEPFELTLAVRLPDAVLTLVYACV